MMALKDLSSLDSDIAPQFQAYNLALVRMASVNELMILERVKMWLQMLFYCQIHDECYRFFCVYIFGGFIIFFFYQSTWKRKKRTTKHCANTQSYYGICFVYMKN